MYVVNVLIDLKFVKKLRICAWGPPVEMAETILEQGCDNLRYNSESEKDEPVTEVLQDTILSTIVDVAVAGSL